MTTGAFFVIPETRPARYDEGLALRLVGMTRRAHCFDAPMLRRNFATIPPLSKQLFPAIAACIFRAVGRAMTRDETVALFLECEAKRAEARAAALAEGKSEDDARDTAHEAAKAHWNAWAEPLLTERKALEASGAWAAEKQSWGSLEPKNEQTRDWIERAASDFSRCLFLVRGAEGTKEAAGEDKDKAKAGDLPVKSIAIDDDLIDMRGFAFPGGASFDSATFSGGASFDSATFSGDARFDSATFSGDARFDSATFSGAASFDSATFSGGASFDSATFSGGASFDSATFSGGASFDSATFSGDAWFGSATFSGDARFDSATFSVDAWFDSATFSGDARFDRATFSGDASFDGATFKSSTSFGQVKFGKAATFAGVKVERAFTMTGAAFAKVPAFNQVDFAQPPDLDDVRFPLPRFWRGGGSKLIAQYRAIRRMAIQGADYEREQMAFKGEIRSKRWTEHRIYHAGLWFGLAYDFFSDFGRSLWRPAFFWALCIPLFAAYFLAQSGAITSGEPGAWLGLPGYAKSAWAALRSPPACYPGTPPKPDAPKEQRPDDIGTGFSGLVEEARARTNPVNEAFSIAYHNALVVLDSNGDSAHRAFGCLYGVERYGGNPVAFVPRAVAIASGVQKLLSAAFIFLFGLALRNMLKVK